MYLRNTLSDIILLRNLNFKTNICGSLVLKKTKWKLKLLLTVNEVIGKYIKKNVTNYQSLY